MQCEKQGLITPVASVCAEETNLQQEFDTVYNKYKKEKFRELRHCIIKSYLNFARLSATRGHTVGFFVKKNMSYRVRESSTCYVCANVESYKATVSVDDIKQVLMEEKIPYLDIHPSKKDNYHCVDILGEKEDQKKDFYAF